MAMKLYGFELDYENSYQKWSFYITHKLFVYRDNKYVEAEGTPVEVNDEVSLYFEKLFSKFIKIAYVDLLNAEKADLKVKRYSISSPSIIIHKIIWRHLNDKVTYLVYDTSSGQPPKHLSVEECSELLSVFGIPIF